MSEPWEHKDFAEAYKDNTGKYSGTEVLQRLLLCLERSYMSGEPLPDIVLSALLIHIEALLSGDESWLLRKADKRRHSDYVELAKLAAVEYVKANPGTTKTVATMYEVSPRTIQRWAEKYDVESCSHTMDELSAYAEDYKQGGRARFWR